MLYGGDLHEEMCNMYLKMCMTESSCVLTFFCYDVCVCKFFGIVCVYVCVLVELWDDVDDVIEQKNSPYHCSSENLSYELLIPVLELF